MLMQMAWHFVGSSIISVSLLIFLPGFIGAPISSSVFCWQIWYNRNKINVYLTPFQLMVARAAVFVQVVAGVSSVWWRDALRWWRDAILAAVSGGGRLRLRGDSD